MAKASCMPYLTSGVGTGDADSCLVPGRRGIRNTDVLGDLPLPCSVLLRLKSTDCIPVAPLSSGSLLDLAEGAPAGDRRWGRAGIGSSCSATTVLRWLLPIVTAPPSTSSPTFQPSDTVPHLKVSASQCGQSWGASKPQLGCPCELYLHEKVSSKIVAECSICV